PAAAARIDCRSSSLAVAPDGGVYLGESRNMRVRHIDPSGIIRTIVGTGIPGYSGAGGPATQARIGGEGNTFKVALAPDGSLYLADYSARRVRHIGTDGIIDTVAGNGSCCTSPSQDGLPALSVPVVPIA